MKEAEYYQKLEHKETRCLLCPHNCRIPAGGMGFCKVRINLDGTLCADNYGKITSIALDPIEKKPLRRFYPGSKILSIGSYGCNFRCGFCQNHDISMGTPGYDSIPPFELAKLSLNLVKEGNIGIAYTYNEPFISVEYLKECAELVHRQKQKNVVVTNGYIHASVCKELLPFIDAVNIDLKSFRNAFYQKLSGNIEPVKQCIELAAAECHVEITTLIIPAENDSEAEIDALAAWIAKIDRKIPLHISRFFPSHQYQHLPPAKIETIYRLAETARNHLEYVYTGNC